MKIKIYIHAKNWFGHGNASAELEADTIEDMEKLIELSKTFDFKVKIR